MSSYVWPCSRRRCRVGRAYAEDAGVVRIPGADTPAMSVAFRDDAATPPLFAFCVGHEGGVWRQKVLLRFAQDHLLRFALRHDELQGGTPEHWQAHVARAAQLVYSSPDFARRGEFGELLLHAVLREFFESEPAVAKIYWKTGIGDTVKGADAVHVTLEPAHGGENELVLWLGEAKFYGVSGDGWRAAAASVVTSLATSKLRLEFDAVVRLQSPGWEHAQRLARLLHRDRALHEIADRIQVPVLVTYDSQALAVPGPAGPGYRAALAAEARRGAETFRRAIERALSEADEATSSVLSRVSIVLLTVPLLGKAEVASAFHERLDNLIEGTS